MSAKTMRNLLAAAVILIVGAGAAGVLMKLGKDPQRTAPPPSRPLVSAYTVPSDGERIRITSFGSVRAKRTVSVVPRVSGEVVFKSPAFEAGGYFTAGAALLKIDDTDYVLAVEQARANVAQSEYSLALAQEEAQVAVREWDRIGGGGDEPTPLVLHEPQLKLARANLEAAGAALAQAELNLARCTITAPFDGRVLDSSVDPGQFIRSGATLGTIYATDAAEITVSVPDGDLAWIRIEGGGLPVDVSAEFAGAVHHWEGRAVRLGGAVDPRSRLVQVVVEIPDPYRRAGDRPPLVEGMFVDVVFTSDPPPGAVVIPRTALRPDDRAWVVDAENRLDIRPLEVARAGVDQVVVASGLSAGERVCTSNLQYVTQGMPVRVEGDPVEARPGAGDPADTATAAKDGER